MTNAGRLVALAAAVILPVSLPGCPPDAGGGPGPGAGGACAEGEPFVSRAPEGCDETFCGAPIVELGTGADGFHSFAGTDTILIETGGQGNCGHHFTLAVRTEGLCPIIYLYFTVEAVLDSGDRVAIAETQHHVMAVRGDDGTSSQAYWGVREFISCEYWPEGGCPSTLCPGNCVAPVPLDTIRVVLRVDAEDHSGRKGSDELELQPLCCGEPPANCLP
jgi:hypothetical protein